MEPLKADRFNAGKLRLELIPPEWKEELGKILTKGASKYGDENWKFSVNTDDHDAFIKDRIGSLERHILKYQSGELYDPETVAGAEHLETTHLGHIATNALMILFYELKKTKEIKRNYAA